MISAATDFSLCIRRASSCSKHADCARAQFGSRNPQRQAFVAPTITGDACAYFYPFSPFRPLAENGGGIADALAESENRGRSEQSGAASRENAGESGSAFTFEAAAQQERSDKTNTSATNATPREPSISDLPSRRPRFNKANDRPSRVRKYDGHLLRKPTTMKTYNGFTLEEMRAEVARELALRRRTYAKWVAAGTMTQADNDQHIGRLAAVLALIDDVEGNQ